MKKITAIILTVLLCLCVTACNAQEEKSSIKTDTISTAQNSMSSFYDNSSKIEEKEQGAAPDTDKTPSQIVAGNESIPTSDTSTADDESYQDIICASTSSYQEIRFLPKNSTASLVFKLPQEWIIEKSDQGFSIVKNAKIIGTVTEDSKIYGEIEHTAQNTLPFGICNYTITKTGTKQYNHVFNFILDVFGSPKTLSLCVDYAELDYNSFYELFYNTVLSWTTNKSNTGAISPANNAKKVAILGNSFIATSQIGNILQQMCGSNITVEAQARGYAKVCTYADDSYILNRIKAGEFSVVLVRGIYDRSDIESFKTLADACNSSNTQLVALPAHNENRQFISMLQEQFPNTLLLDWKNEIDTLISNGISIDEFCVNDSNQHSTPLAGYVGAHMIYRAIYGKVPTQKSFSEVTAQQINLLGDYVNTGLADSSAQDGYIVYRF